MWVITIIPTSFICLYIKSRTKNSTIENISKIAKALDVNISALFEFKHKQKRKDLQKEIFSTIENSDDDEIELIFKIIKDICL